MKSRSRATTISRLLVVTSLVICATPGSPAVTRTQARRDLSQSAGGAVAAKRVSDEAKRLSDEGSEQSLKAAIARYEQALQLYRNIGDRGSEGSTLNNVGFVYQSLGDNQKALEYYNQALPVLRDAGDRSGEARTLSNIGSTISGFSTPLSMKSRRRWIITTRLCRFAELQVIAAVKLEL